MAEAHKCDVIDCQNFDEGTAPGEVVFNALGVKKHMCQKHTDALVNSYFPDLEQQEAAPGTPADKAEA